MNSPLTKYAPKQLVFFNYHEYLSEEYTSADALEHSHEVSKQDPPAVVINHFPNPYIPQDSELFTKTRIIRIPRVFDSCDESYIVPQFSLFYPGKEPGAIVGTTDVCVQGQYMGQFFGFESRSPLDQWLEEDELKEIINTINKQLFDAYSPENSLSVVENGLDFLSATLYSSVYLKLFKESRQKRIVAQVDEYIDRINREMLSKRHHLLVLVPVSTSAMLSLDFQVPTPTQVSPVKM